MKAHQEAYNEHYLEAFQNTRLFSLSLLFVVYMNLDETFEKKENGRQRQRQRNDLD